MPRAAVFALIAACVAAPAAAQQKGLGPADVNGDGKLTREENRSAAVKELLKYDKNKDGRVMQAELPAMAKMPGVRGQVAQIWKVYDSSGDGAVSREEVTAVAERNFTQADANRDGALDQAEIDAARKAAEAARKKR